MHKATAQRQDPEEAAEGKKITEAIAALKYELQHNRKLTPLPDDGQPDIKSYNDELEKRSNPQWHDVSWLYAECYLYRRLATIFATSQHWKHHDVFAKQKMSTFRSSRPAVLELAARYNELVKQLDTQDSLDAEESEADTAAAEKLLFTEMCDICLWGNATDLSLLTNLSYDDIQKLQGSEARKKNEKNIIANDLDAAYDTLKSTQRADPTSDRQIDIVLDNSGFELYVDLILAGYLLHAGLATRIVLHPKNIPWFVSDVTPGDFSALLNALLGAKRLYETPSEDESAQGKSPEALSDDQAALLEDVFQDWAQLHADGKIILRANIFWTSPGAYWRLPHVAKVLFADLQRSQLVIFKGDLNYRKLVGDALWDPTTPFAEAVGPLGLGSGMRTLALRTCKADVVVGLPKGKDEELRQTEGGGGDSGQRKWAWSGKYAVVSFVDGKAKSGA